jgi:hypothetical protein
MAPSLADQTHGAPVDSQPPLWAPATNSTRVSDRPIAKYHRAAALCSTSTSAGAAGNT